ncbi:hypothetical protein ABYF34_00690 [Buchananella felis]|uniref:hypothetical protein n=1 Tax=Buchananella felis TaxID=3231492 RepID=UPI0035294C35
MDRDTINHARALRDHIFTDSQHLNPKWVEETDATVIAQENESSLHPDYFPAIIRACNTISPGATWWAISHDFTPEGRHQPTSPKCWRIIPTEESLDSLSLNIFPFDCMIFTDDLNAAFSFVNAYEFTLVAGPRRFIDAYAGSYATALKDISEYIDYCVQQELELGFPKAAETIRATYAVPMSQMRLGNA